MGEPLADAPTTPATTAYTDNTLVSVPASVLGAVQQILSLHPLSDPVRSFNTTCVP